VLDALGLGEGYASRDLLPLVYDELRQLAAQRLAHERPGQTLQATALVHEAYLRLVGGDPGRPWHGRAHFFAAAAEAMRRILVDRARGKASQKAGGTLRRLELGEFPADVEGRPDLSLALDEALTELEWHGRKVEALLLAHDRAGTFLDHPAPGLAASPPVATGEAPTLAAEEAVDSAPAIPIRSGPRTASVASTSRLVAGP
jgi:RNA polymerase sigma factor (TIGR02999 family)